MYNNNEITMIKVSTYRNIKFEIIVSLNSKAVLNLENDLRHYIMCRTLNSVNDKDYYKSYTTKEGSGELMDGINTAELDIQKWIDTVTTGDERTLLSLGFKFE